MIVKIVDKYGKIYGLHLYENNSTGDVSVLDCTNIETYGGKIESEYGVITSCEKGCDDIFATKEQQITITIKDNSNDEEVI